MTSDHDRAVGRAWLVLCSAVAVHVADEAATGFLAVYNPTALRIREALPWLQVPVFRFEVWLAGLILAILAMVALSRAVFRGARWTRAAAYLFAGLMLANALGHTLATLFGWTIAWVEVPRPAPGFYSSPLLAAASIYLLHLLCSPCRSRARGALAGG